MKQLFDMGLFLEGVLAGSQATRLRHIKQAKMIQIAILQRWQRSNPWTWRLKHIRWLLDIHLKKYSHSTRYYYYLTAQLIIKRLGKDKSWQNGNAK